MKHTHRSFVECDVHSHRRLDNFPTVCCHCCTKLVISVDVKWLLILHPLFLKWLQVVIHGTWRKGGRKKKRKISCIFFVLILLFYNLLTGNRRKRNNNLYSAFCLSRQVYVGKNQIFFFTKFILLVIIDKSENICFMSIILMYSLFFSSFVFTLFNYRISKSES